MRSVTKAPVRTHRLEYGEDLSWSPPEGAVKFLVWSQPIIQTYADDDVPTDVLAYGGAAPAWTEVGGFDIAADAKITPDAKATPLAGFEATATGVAATWRALLVLAQGLLVEVVQVIAYDGDGRAIAIDRYRVPAPSSTDASVIAAQETRVLQHLLAARERAATGGGLTVYEVEGERREYENLGVLDRRIAEVRARVAWFSQAAEGNALPRQEFW